MQQEGWELSVISVSGGDKSNGRGRRLIGSLRNGGLFKSALQRCAWNLLGASEIWRSAFVGFQRFAFRLASPRFVTISTHRFNESESTIAKIIFCSLGRSFSRLSRLSHARRRRNLSSYRISRRARGCNRPGFYLPRGSNNDARHIGRRLLDRCAITIRAAERTEVTQSF